MSEHFNYVRQGVTGTPGTGTITLGAAASGYLSMSTAIGRNATVDLNYTDGSAKGCERNCTYNHGAGTVTRGTHESSTTGSQLSLTSAAVVSVAATAAFGNSVENYLGSWGALSGENSITGTATALIGRLNVCSGTTSDYTVTLPAVSGNAGRYIGFRMAPGLTRFVTLDGNASETIDGATTRVMWAQETALLYCDGTTWTKMAGKSRALYCHMAPSANATLVNGTELKSTLNATIADNSTRMADTTNGRMTVRRASTYNLAVSSRVFGASSNIVRFLGIGRKNGSASDYTVQAEISVLSGAFAFAYLSIPLGLLVSDYFELWALQDSGTNKTWSGDGSTQQSNMSLIEVPQW